MDSKIFETIEKAKRIIEGKGRTFRACVVTYGCQQNEADSEKARGMLAAMGYLITNDETESDLILVNTCAVREHAEKKTLSVTGGYKHLKTKNPDLIIGMCGCMVSKPDRCAEIRSHYPYIDFFLGTEKLYLLPEAVLSALNNGKASLCNDGDTYMPEGLPVVRDVPYKAAVTVMYGCDNFCSYCIVPYVRGRQRSRRAADIIEEAKEAVASGCREIMLLGQNVNSYGSDNGECDFADLISSIADIEGDFLIRFMSSHPKDASNKLIDAMASHDRIAKQFHLPVQSGSDRVLREMNRKYDCEKYLSILRYMREKIPDITVTSDIIVGFPGETEQDFSDTLEMLKKARFDMIFSFIYSPRGGTPAARREDQIPDEVKSERFKRLVDAQNEISFEKNQALVGRTVRVLCEGESDRTRLYSGRTEGGKLVHFEGGPGDAGRYIRVRITSAQTFLLYGEKI